MIKNYGDKKLSKTGSHRRAMFANMLSSLIMSEKVITTFPKAKELGRFMDKVISDAKKQRYSDVKSAVRNKIAFKKIIDVIAPRYQSKSSGFTNIIKIGPRKGDASLMALIKMAD